MKTNPQTPTTQANESPKTYIIWASEAGCIREDITEYIQKLTKEIV